MLLLFSLIACASGGWAMISDGLASRGDGVDRNYVGRMLRLTSLVPQIVEAILDRDEPEGISLAELRNELPVLWAEL